MWKLIRIKAENIVSFRELEMDLTQDVATMIFGQNNDNNSQKANGSGKSSLIEIISMGITGEPLRKVKVDEIINDNADDARIELYLENRELSKKFQIIRNIHRKGAQEIECHLYNIGGLEIETEKTVQPGVLDYNRFILDEIGLSKDDVYSNYILCRNKYKSFFDSSDRDKKELINRFSNGVLVDGYIEKLNIDLIPAEDKVRESENTLSKIRGKVEAIDEQIADAQTKQQQFQKSKDEKIAVIHQRIADKRKEIDEINALIEKSDIRLDEIDKFGDEIEKLEKGVKSLDECCRIITDGIVRLSLGDFTDYKGLLISYKEQLESLQKSRGEQSERLTELNNQAQEAKALYDAECGKYDIQKSGFEKIEMELKSDIASCEQQREREISELRSISLKIGELDKINDRLNGKISNAKAVLYGTIECPKCGHKFLLDKDKDLNTVQAEMERNEKDVSVNIVEQNKLKGDSKLTEKRISEIDDKLLKINDKRRENKLNLSNLDYSRKQSEQSLLSLNNRIQLCSDDITTMERQIDSVSGKISNISKQMFDEAYSIIDNRIDRGEDYVKSLKEKITLANASIGQFRESIAEIEKSESGDILETLNKSKLSYQRTLESSEKLHLENVAKRDLLKEQEIRFNDFKAHLARTKLDAISAVVNTFLKEIGSDIQVMLDGFTKLKSGKIRDKISVHVYRDGVDCGSFYKFSAGERARVELACILAMQKLTNESCENGKGLDLVVCDEVLDSSDESGIASYCKAINQLGYTALVVTQNAVAENYPYKLIVTKENGISTVSQCNNLI